MGGRLAWVVAVLAALAPGAAHAASAASVYRQGFPGTPAFLYTAAPGEANRVSLTGALSPPDVVLVADDGAAVSTDTCAPSPLGALCTSLVHRNEATGLPGTGPLGWGYARVELRDGSDTLVIRGLTVAGGMDVFAGDGNDSLDTAGGAREFVHCGPGTDSVRADGADVIDPTCERVSR